MSYDEDEDVGGGFKMTDDENFDEDMELDPPADMDFGLDEEDPDRDG